MQFRLRPDQVEALEARKKATEQEYSDTVREAIDKLLGLERQGDK